MRQLQHFVGIFSVVLVIYGSFLLFPTVGIDTEVAIIDYSGLLDSWKTVGRVGLVLLKEWFFPAFHPVIANSLTIVSLSIFIWLITRLLHSSSVLVGFIIAACPITYYQLYFQMQSFEVILGSILTLISFYIIVNKHYLLLVPMSLLAGFSISIYQSLFDFSIACGFLFLLLKKDRKISDFLKVSFAFLLELVTYWGIGKLLRNGATSAYLSIEFLNKYSIFAWCIILILGISCFLLYKNDKLDFMGAFSLWGFLSASFVTIAFIGSIKYRALFPTLPVVFALVSYYCFYHYNKSWIKSIVASGGIVFLLATLGLQLAEWRRYHQDIELAEKIVKQIPSENYRVQFVGKYSDGNTLHDQFIVEPPGESFFAWDPVPNQVRSENILRLVGGEFQSSTIAENRAAEVNFKGHPSFLDTGKVWIDEVEQLVVVKFK